MKELDTIKEIFVGLPVFAQESILDELLQEYEVSGQALDLAYEKIAAERQKKPCPYCKSEKVLKRGSQKGVQMYQCKTCVKWYSETTGTPLWDIKLKSKWQSYLRCMEQGMSLKKIATELHISIQTSFDWRHKILSSLNKYVPQSLSGVVESDELELALSHKGKRNIDRKPRKRGTDFKRNNEDEITVVQVVTAVERGGETFFKAVESKRLDKEEIKLAFESKLTQGTLLITDSHPSYKAFVKDIPEIKHKTFIAKEHTNKENKNIHVQTVNNKHKQLKQFLDPFNGVSSKYLQNYLNWFAYADKLRQTKQTIKQWIIGGLLTNEAYELFWQFKENAVNIRI